MNFCSLSSATAAFFFLLSPAAIGAEDLFEGKHFRGKGDVEYLRLLDMARRMFEPDPEFQNLSMLYTTSWNGLIEGPTWDAWWIQNSYGTTYAALPFCREPFLTFLQNSQDLWFDQMGDGKRVGAPPPFNWVAPDGALCDAARPGWVVYKHSVERVPHPLPAPLNGGSSAKAFWDRPADWLSLWANGWTGSGN